MGKYYKAAHLQSLVSRVSFRSFNTWTEIEKLWAAPTHPNAWLWSSLAVLLSSGWKDSSKNTALIEESLWFLSVSLMAKKTGMFNFIFLKCLKLRVTRIL